MRYQYTRRITRVPVRYPNRIHRYRVALELSQRDLAEQLNCTPSTVSAWERGKTFPRGPRLLQLAKTLNILVEALYWAHYARTPEAIQEKHQPERSEGIAEILRRQDERLGLAGAP